MTALRRMLSRWATPSAARSLGPIGLELGAGRLAVVQLERDAASVRVRARACVPLPDPAPPEALRPLVRETLARGAFRGRKVVTAMPDADVKLMIVDYELEPTASEPEAILGFVAERTDGALEDLVVDYRVIRTSEEQAARSALVAVARRDAVVAYLERLRGSGLRVEALEIAPIAIHRLVSCLGREAHDEHRLVLHAGRSKSHLIVLTGRRLHLYREVEFGADAVAERLAKALDMSAEAAAGMLARYGAWPDEQGEQSWSDPAEAFEIAQTVREILKPCTQVLTTEVKRAGAYMASQWRGATLDRILLLGRFAAWPRIDRLLENAFALPTRVLDPLSELATRPGAGPDGEAGDEMSLAAGLALRGMTDGG